MKSAFSVTLLAIIIIIFSHISLSYSQAVVNYSFSFYNNGTCQPTQVGECIPCQLKEGAPVNYYQIYSPYWGEYGAHYYVNSLCTELPTFSELINYKCSSLASGGNNCVFFATIDSAILPSLSLTSTESIEVSFGDYSDVNDVYTEISSNTLFAQTDNLNIVLVRSASGKNFIVESRVSDTQYSSNFGVFNYGEIYTRSPFTFNVSLIEVDFPPPMKPQLRTINFYPFISTKVTSNKTFIIYYSYYDFAVFVDENFDLDGLVLKNPYFSFQNMTFFLPYHPNKNPDHGQLVYETSNSLFLTRECRHSFAMINSGTINAYNCAIENSTLIELLNNRYPSYHRNNQFN